MDSTWEPVRYYIRDHVKPNDRDKCYFDSYDPSELEQVVKNTTTSYIIQTKEIIILTLILLIVIYDFADDTNFTRKS